MQTVYAPNNPQSPVTLMKKGAVSLVCELELHGHSFEFATPAREAANPWKGARPCVRRTKTGMRLVAAGRASPYFVGLSDRPCNAGLKSCSGSEELHSVAASRARQSWQLACSR